MYGLIEIIFEELDLNTVVSVLRELTQDGKKIEACKLSNDSGTEVEVDWSTNSSISKSFTLANNSVIFLRFTELSMSDLVIPRCCLGVWFYDPIFELEFYFGCENIPAGFHRSFAQCMMEFATDIAGRYGIDDYYAGLEPASDEDTRFFTRNVKSTNWKALVDFCQPGGY